MMTSARCARTSQRLSFPGTYASFVGVRCTPGKLYGSQGNGSLVEIGIGKLLGLCRPPAALVSAS